MDHVELTVLHTSDATVAREVCVCRYDDVAGLDVTDCNFKQTGITEVVYEHIA